MDDYQSHDAVGLAELVREKQVSAAGAAGRGASACRRGQRPDQRRSSSTSTRPRPASVTGPFAGVPFLLKDLGQDLEGYPTSGGSRSLVDHAGRRERHRRPALARRRAGRLRQDQHPGVRRQGRRPSRTCSARPATRGTPTTRPAAPPAARRQRSRRASCPAPRPATAAARSGSRPRPAGCSGSSRRAAWCPPARWSRRAWAARRPTASSRARSATPRRCSTSSSAARRTGRTCRPCPRRRTPTRWARSPAPLRIGLCTASSINPTPDPEAVAAATSGRRAARVARATTSSTWTRRRSTTRRSPRTSSPPGSSTPPTRSRRPRRSAAAGDSGFEPDTLVMAALGRATDPVDLVRAIENRQAHVRRLAAFHESYDLLLTPTHGAAAAQDRRARPAAGDAEGAEGAGQGARRRAAAVHARSSSS